MRNKIYIFVFLFFCFLSTCLLFSQETQQNESTKLSEEEFIEKYDKWLPERIVSYGQLRGGTRPIPRPDNIIWLQCLGTKKDDKWSVYIHLSAHDDAMFEIPPYPNFFKTLRMSNYQTRVGYIPRYSIFPIFGRFYYADFQENFGELANNKDIRDCLGVAHRLNSEEYPDNVSLSQKSIVFFRSTPQPKSFEHDPGTYSGTLYRQSIYVKDIHLSPDSKIDCQVNIAITRPGKMVRIPEDLHEGWYKVGDVLKFGRVGHRIINIVAPRELEREVRGHKCYLVGYIELDPEAIPRDESELEEPEELPPPQPKPALTEEEKAEMRTWNVTRLENDKKKVYEVTAAFGELQKEWVHLRYSDMRYGSIPLNAFSNSDQEIIHKIISQRQQFSAEVGIDFSLVPHENYKQEVDGESVTITQVIGEDIWLTLKAKNVTDGTISVYAGRLSNNECYNVYVSSKRGKSIKSMFIKHKPISLDSKDWRTLKPNEEYLYSIPQDKFARWQLPRNGDVENFSMIGGNVFVYRHNKLDMPLESRKKIVANGSHAKIFVGGSSVVPATIVVQIVLPPIERKELLLQKAAKYIERTFSKEEVAGILKVNGGVDVYSEKGKDMIKIFLQLYSLSAEELEKFLVKYSDIDGFERMEFVYRKLAMFNSDTSKQTRETMKSTALEKHKKELTDTPIEADNDINTDTDIENNNDLSNPIGNSVSESNVYSNKFWFVLIVCCFIVTIILTIVVIIFHKRKSTPTIPKSKP